jgi:3-oxoacyl-[acyl-carrier-protein] synthase-3
MDATNENIRLDHDPGRSEFSLSRDVSLAGSEVAPQLWHDSRKLKVLGMSTELHGRPVTTSELLKLIEDRFGVAVSRRGTSLAGRLKIARRHICRDFETRHEKPRAGNSNPDLVAVALRMALEDAQLKIGDLAYLIGHTTSPASLIPPNIALVADRVGFAGPYVELRQACTGFANALVITQGLVSAPGVRAVATAGSETGSVYFDPQRAGEDVSQLVNLMMTGDGAAAIVVGPDDSGPGARISNNFFAQIGLGRRSGFALASGGSDQAFVERGSIDFEHDFAAVRASGPELFYRGAEAARSFGIGVETVDYVVPHQANGRMAELLAPFLGIEQSQVFRQRRQYWQHGFGCHLARARRAAVASRSLSACACPGRGGDQVHVRPLPLCS